jgi:5'-nucleotidase / UDP-sugar diphosphatase
MTAIEISDLDCGCHAIDHSGKDEHMYSLTCFLYVGLILAAIPKYTKAYCRLCPKIGRGGPSIQ